MKNQFNILAQNFLAKTREAQARFGIAKVVWYNDKQAEEEEVKVEREGSLGQNHTSHPERNCISIILISFTFVDGCQFSLLFRNCTRSNTGCCFFFVWEQLFLLVWVELLAVGLEGSGSAGSIGLDWIELDGCEGDPEMVIGWEWERRTYVRTVLYYCVVCQPAVPACFTWYWRLVSGWYGIVWYRLGWEEGCVGRC
jgi:hypothetical protein